MDLPKAPTQNDVSIIAGAWNWIVFFVGLIFTGGLLEYLVSKRYVTRKEWVDTQAAQAELLEAKIEIALLKNNERLEERMVSAVSKAISNSLASRRKGDELSNQSLP